MGLHRHVIFTGNNQVTLLQCGAEFFPALISAIDDARSEIYLETYLFSQDLTANLVHDALCNAALRGVKVHVIVDWLGTGEQRSTALEKSFTPSGVQFRRFNPWFRRGVARTHRKLFVADQRIGIIGGININHDLFAEGENKRILEFPRWDFAVQIQGPLVADVHQLMMNQWRKLGSLDWRQRLALLKQPLHDKLHSRLPILAGLAPRDNIFYRRTIQKAYLHALGNAREEAMIVTPYFAPGRKFRSALIQAAGRGVKVTLLIGCGDFSAQDAVAQSYYPKLLTKGINIIEYRKSQLHAKVALIDHNWATIGSSNCDGLSLFINQEANIIIKDPAFSAILKRAIRQGSADGVVIDIMDYKNITWYRKFWYGCAFFIYSSLIRLFSIDNYK